MDDPFFILANTNALIKLSLSSHPLRPVHHAVQGSARAHRVHGVRFVSCPDFWTKNQDKARLFRSMTEPIEARLSRIVLSTIRLKKTSVSLRSL